MAGSDNPDCGLDDLHISACDAQGRNLHLSPLHGRHRSLAK